VLECPCKGDKFSLFADVPTSSGWASVTESRITIAYPAKHVPSQVKLLLSVKYLKSRLVGFGQLKKPHPYPVTSHAPGGPRQLAIRWPGLES
jgi:hypothetical protein